MLLDQLHVVLEVLLHRREAVAVGEGEELVEAQAQAVIDGIESRVIETIGEAKAELLHLVRSQLVLVLAIALVVAIEARVARQRLDRDLRGRELEQALHHLLDLLLTPRRAMIVELHLDDVEAGVRHVIEAEDQELRPLRPLELRQQVGRARRSLVGARRFLEPGKAEQQRYEEKHAWRRHGFSIPCEVGARPG
jgi:hypothetical protein